LEPWHKASNQQPSEEKLHRSALFIGFQISMTQRSTQKSSFAFEPSVGSRGESYDNALAELINGLYKAELIHRRAP
jgi:transposase InsO family protein